MYHTSEPAELSGKDLVREIVSDASLLVQRQVKLATLEAKSQLHREKQMASLVGVAGGVGFAAVILFLVCAAIAIGSAIGALWSGPLIVGGFLAIVAGILFAIGWARRVKEPLPESRREIEKETTWLKQQWTTT